MYNNIHYPSLNVASETGLELNISNTPSGGEAYLKIWGMYQMNSSFTVTIFYHDNILGEDRSESFYIEEFPANILRRIDGSSDYTITRIDSDYGGGGSANCAIVTYAPVDYSSWTENLANFGMNTGQTMLKAPNSFAYDAPIHGFIYQYGSTGDKIRVKVTGYTQTGSFVSEQFILTNGDSMRVLSEPIFWLTFVETNTLTTASGTLSYYTKTGIIFGDAVSYTQNSFNITDYQNSFYAFNYSINGQEDIKALFVKANNTDNSASLPATINFTKTGNVSDAIVYDVQRQRGLSQGDLRIFATGGSTKIYALDTMAYDTYDGTTGTFEYGWLQLPAEPTPNTPPYVFNSIGTQTVNVGTVTDIDLSDLFRDDQNDDLVLSIIDELNFNDATFASIISGGHQLILRVIATSMQAGKTYNFVIQAAEQSTSDNYTATSNIEVVVNGSTSPTLQAIGNVADMSLGFIKKETDTYYIVAGWFPFQNLNDIAETMRIALALPGANAIISKVNVGLPESESPFILLDLS